MSAYTTCVAVCQQDVTIAAQASLVIEQLAEAFETFKDKRGIDAIRGVHEALIEWDEITSGLDPTEGLDLTVTVVTEETEWVIDFADPQWVLDLPMSIFHCKLIFAANVATVED